MRYIKGILPYYLVILIFISLAGFLLEFYSIFINRISLLGITNNIFYFYVLFLETILFLYSFYLFRGKNQKFVGYVFIGSSIAIIVGILNLLIASTHLLLFLEPISDPNYSISSIISELSVIIIIGIFSVPLILKLKINDV